MPHCWLPIILYLFCTPLLVRADEAPPGHVYFGGLPTETEEIFMRGVREGATLTFPSVKILGDKSLEPIWRSGLPTLTTEVTRARLLFSRRWQHQAAPSSSLILYNPAADEVSEDYFTLFLDFSDSGVELKSSRSGLKSPDSGLTLSGGERRIVPVTVVPESGLRMVLLVPRITNERTFGMFLCPRLFADEALPTPTVNPAEPTPTPKPPRKVLVDGGYRIVSVSVEISGALRGKILGGFGPARAAGKLLTSIDIPSSIESQDETFSRDPSISIEYLANKQDPYRVADEAHSPLVDRASGIRAEMDLQNPAGYRVQDQLQEVLRVKELSFPPIAPIQLNANLDSGTGPCYLVLKERTQNFQFSKEALMLPERLATESPTP